MLMASMLSVTMPRVWFKAANFWSIRMFRELNGDPVTANQIVSVSDIDGGNLMFLPNQGMSGGPYFLVKFQVEDNGGTANGGANLDPTPKLLYIRLNN